MGAMAFIPMVASASFATDLERLIIRSLVDASQAARGALLNDVDDGAAGRCCHLGREQACALLWGESKLRFVRRSSRKVEGVKARRRIQDAIVEQNSYQGGQRCWSITRSPDSAGIRRCERLERIAEAFPKLVHLGESLELQ